MPTVTGVYNGRQVTLEEGFVDLETNESMGMQRPIYHIIHFDGIKKTVPVQDVEIRSINGLPFKPSTNGHAKKSDSKSLVKGKITLPAKGRK